MMATTPNFGTPNWLSQPGMNNPGFDQFLQSIAQDRANYDPAFGFTNTPVSALYQELGEGNQGQQLLSDYSHGLTADQVHQAYYGQYGGVDPAAVAALGDTDPSQLTGQMKTLYQQGLLQYTPPVAGTPGQTADAPGSWSLTQPVTHTGDPGAPGNDPTIAQPLFNHSTQTGLNTGAFGFDPTKGFVTSPTNVHGSSSNSFMDNYVPLLSKVALGAIGGGALAPTLGAFAAPAFNSAMTALQGGNINPGSFLGAGLSALGLPPQVMQALQAILPIMQGKGINPLTLGSMAAKYALGGNSSGSDGT
jgi:hypothetical protein